MAWRMADVMMRCGCLGEVVMRMALRRFADMLVATQVRLIVANLLQTIGRHSHQFRVQNISKLRSQNNQPSHLYGVLLFRGEIGPPMPFEAAEGALSKERPHAIDRGPGQFGGCIT